MARREPGCTTATGWSKSARNVFVAPWLCGAAALICDERFDAVERLEVIEREGVNVLCQAPTEYRMLSRDGRVVRVRDEAVTVRDDGTGMTPEQARAALKGLSGGIGLSNVHRRLRATFGEEYGVTIESEPGAGAKVSIVIPKSHPGVRAGPALARAA